MKIERTSFNTFFPRVDNLRRKLFDFEDKLVCFFNQPFVTLPIPDDAPSDIPRFQAESKNGHSQLAVSLDRLSFQTNYDDRLNNEWSKCLSYLDERIIPMTDLIKDLVNNNFLYSGLSTEIFFQRKDPIHHLMDKFFSVSHNVDPFDANLKLTYVLHEKYYVNVTINNTRIYSGTGNFDKVVPAYLSEVDQGIILQLDINDRYGYNYTKDYSSSSDEVKMIFDLTTQIIETKIEEIIEKGVVEL